MKTKLLNLLLFASFVSNAQFTTPNTGSTFRLSDLATIAPTAVSVSGNVYTLSQNLTVAATDTFLIDSDLTLKINDNIQIIVQGEFISDATEILITATDIATPYNSIIFEAGSQGFMRNTTINYGKGIRLATGDFEMQSCTMSYHKNGTTTSGAIQFTTGKPIINNSTFKFNFYCAFASAVNAQTAPEITNNFLEGNNQSNGNRPQINLGLTGSETLKIIGNTIKGDRTKDMTGGISIANFTTGLSNAIIQGNTIYDNRYGINALGYNINMIIDGNIIQDNNTNSNPLTSGSGITCQGAVGSSCMVKISNNQIRRNLWGITAVGNTTFVNLGDGQTVAGGNIFAENTNNGQVYAFYNNTANAVMAMNNCWIEGTVLTAESVESVISHQVDDPTLGPVTFTPFGCTELSTPDFALAKPKIFPNPSHGNVTIEILEDATLEIYSINGVLVSTKNLASGSNNVATNFPAGIYLMKMDTKNKSHVQKLVVN